MFRGLSSNFVCHKPIQSACQPGIVKLSLKSYLRNLNRCVMNEQFLVFVWKYKLYEASSLTFNGLPMEIINVGEANEHSGPDFFNTQVRVGDTLWIGNAEVHLKASDWNLHGHHKNQAYDNVILHIVAQNDADVYTSKGRKVPAIELKSRPEVMDKYHNLNSHNGWVACANLLDNVSRVHIVSMLDKTGTERLQERSESFTHELQKAENNLEETLYRRLFHSFGFHVNSQPFDLLALATPYSVVRKYTHSLFQTEALLFGQAGFLLNDYNTDIYFQQLRTEYEFLKSKHSLNPIDVHLWKFMRLRPGNFPTLRIAQLAALLHKSPALVTVVLEAPSVQTLESVLMAPLSSFWQNHYTFDKDTKSSDRTLGANSARIILINTLVPLYFAYGKLTGNNSWKEKALSFLAEIPPEKKLLHRELAAQWH